MAAFWIETTAHRDRTRLAVVGEVDLEAVPFLTEIGLSSLSEPSTRLVVIDLARVTFMNSAALEALLRLRDAAEEMNKGLVLSRLPERVRKLLSVTALDTVFVEVAHEPSAATVLQPTVILAA
jgi:anti-sigma B factor antagonist